MAEVVAARVIATWLPSPRVLRQQRKGNSGLEAVESAFLTTRASIQRKRREAKGEPEGAGKE